MKIADNPFYIGILPTGNIRIENTAESLATFICTAGKYCNIFITVPDKRLILNTSGIWINQCFEKDFLEELKQVLIPMQKELMNELGFPECP